MVGSEKYECCGCSACAEACVKGCIMMKSDEEGFMYPITNESECISCRLCEKVCPERNVLEEKKPLHVYAARNLNDEVRGRSSSGGIFYLLAQKILSKKGVVFGVRFDEKQMAVFDYAQNSQELERLMGSKYVQAQVGDTYEKVKSFLRDGLWVMFSGTPCQIAGLKRYLRKDYEKLLTVDIACHGVPSPKVWNKYIDELQEKNGKIQSINFRSKYKGWKNFMFSVSYIKNNKAIQSRTPFWNNLFMRAFLSDLILRPSCYLCKFKGGRSGSDITLGDYWGIQYIKPNMDDDKGTSIILINTTKGYDALDFDKIKSEETTYSQGYSMNPALLNSPNQPLKRAEFFEKINDKECVGVLMNKMLQSSWKERIKRRLKICKLYTTHLNFSCIKNK